METVCGLTVTEGREKEEIVKRKHAKETQRMKTLLTAKLLRFIDS